MSMQQKILKDNPDFIKQRSKGRRTFVMIALLFFGPFVLATLAHKMGWTPSGDSVNRGQLIQAEIPLLAQALQIDERDETIELRKKWSLLLFVPNACGEACKAEIEKFEIVHFRLNRDIERVQFVVVNDQSSVESPFARKVTKGASENALLESVENLELATEGLYVVDPLGFAVSKYALDSGAEDLQKDLKRLLKVSRIG